jgi:acyl-[acyl carrier protein]--UDP-N-acetylglucosamine O-acyltransferase
MEQKIRRLNKHGLTLDDISKKQIEEVNTAIRELDSLISNLNKEKQAKYMRHTKNDNT